ncbi:MULTISPECIES: Bug family tripartite tricarboxylate transporter substrate binding protein [Cupriavidus]|uniref:Tripartite tricarboxylate transporter substrate binding protein n=1 Tax=Cupriavidus oxalaticus TaxID=96344 RepID=A0A4P7LFQ6_9BURK|nr:MULTISPECIES: tripartite tricarboxylate transporter substrate binding protein [Cupriavidus]MBF6990417.1 tripartite tricarboxylate transporter substrate binding protein [Cupriavidus sp. IK-TO18]QBY50671.1 tripartite tricarboxylate transporter substrate binding protein [Cupriavidus oxalaticus]
MQRRTLLKSVLAISATLAVSLTVPGLEALAQGGAGKPVRLILPISAGSGVDTIARAAGPALGKAFGQPVVIENLPGAGGITGAAAVVKAQPDGSTLGLVSNNHVINPSVFRAMPFDAIKDITPISVIGTTPLVLVVNPRVPAKNVKELVALLKARPDGYNYASSGNGTIIHLAGEMFLDEAGVTARHVPYKGTGPMINDLLAGQVEMGVVALNAVAPHLKAGTLRAIGLCGDKRTDAAPDIATIAEQGLPRYNVAGWFAVIGPAGMPAPEVRRVHDAFARAFTSPEVLEAMKKQGTVVEPGTPEAAAAFFRSEAARYAALVKKANVKVE